MTPDEIRERYRFDEGDQVRYYGRIDLKGTVQSVWDLCPDISTAPADMGDVLTGRFYVVRWSTGQVTTVPAGYLLPYGSRRASTTTELWLVSIFAFAAMVIGLLIPFIGWLCITAPVAVAYAAYLRDRKAR